LRLVSNCIVNWIGFAVSVVVAYFLTPIFIRSLGDETYGVWALIESAILWMALFDMGIGASVVRYVSSYQAARNHVELNNVFNTTLAIFCCFGLLAFGISISIALLFEQPFGLEGASAVDARWLFAILGLNTGLELIFGVFTAALIGLEKFNARVAIDASVRVVGAVAMVIVVSSGHGVAGLAFCSLAQTLVRGIASSIALRIFIPHLRPTLLGFSWKSFRLIRGYSARAFLVMIAGNISYRIDPLIIGIFLLPKYVTYYVLALRLVEYGINSVSSLCAALTPAFSNMESRNDYEAIRNTFRKSFRWISRITTPLVFGFVFLGKPFLTIWISGEHATNAYPVLVVLSVPLLIYLPCITASRVLYGIGRLKEFSWVAWGQAIVNLLISVVLVQYIGIVGVALGTAIPNVVVSLVTILLACRYSGQNPKDLFVETLYSILLPSMTLFFSWFVLTRLFEIEEWSELLLVALAGLIPYGIMMLAVERYKTAKKSVKIVQELSSEALSKPDPS